MFLYKSFSSRQSFLAPKLDLEREENESFAKCEGSFLEKGIGLSYHLTPRQIIHLLGLKAFKKRLIIFKSKPKVAGDNTFD